MTEDEKTGGVKILTGPPVPALLPAKGVGMFFETGATKFFSLSRFNNSDTIIGTPLSMKNAWVLFWNLWRSKK